MNLLTRLIINTLAVFAASYILPGIHVHNFTTAIVVAVVLALLNAFLKPLLVLLTIPVTIVTLGLFLLVINAVIVLICAELVHGFRVDGFFYALLFSLVISLFSSIMERLAK
ncbi:phage holin family protein [Chitinophagaceae bacterium MMS25-I14]